MQFSYELRRSNRRTLAIEVTARGQVIVRAPKTMPNESIMRFLTQKEAWVLKNIAKMHARPPKPAITPEQAAKLKRQAGEYIPARVAYYSQIMGVTPAGVKITSAQKRFGSCSGKNSLCFAWRLMLYPPEAIDYVVVHELAHILHHNHSPKFYNCIAKYMPDYRERAALLK